MDLHINLKRTALIRGKKDQLVAEMTCGTLLNPWQPTNNLLPTSDRKNIQHL